MKDDYNMGSLSEVRGSLSEIKPCANCVHSKTDKVTKILTCPGRSRKPCGSFNKWKQFEDKDAVV